MYPPTDVAGKDAGSTAVVPLDQRLVLSHQDEHRQRRAHRKEVVHLMEGGREGVMSVQETTSHFLKRLSPAVP